MERKISRKPLAMQFGKKFRESIARTGLTQKYVAYKTGRSNSTINNLTHDYPVSPNEAVSIGNVVNDSQFSQELGNMMLGLIKPFTGPRMPRSNLSALLDIDEFEERQEKQACDDGNIRLIIGNPEALTAKEESVLREYLNQKLDSTVMDMTLLVAGTEKLDITMMQLFDDRMPDYIAKHYMKGDEPRWQRKPE